MISYILRRLAATVPVLFTVAVMVFLMLRLTAAGDRRRDHCRRQCHHPADPRHPHPARPRAAHSPAVLHLARRSPAGRAWRELADFRKTVFELISERIEPTLSLAFLTIVLAVLIAIPLGVIAAYKQGTWIDRIVMGFSVIGFSVPVFVIGYLPDLRLRHQARLAPGPGIPAYRQRHLAVARAHWCCRR